MIDLTSHTTDRPLEVCLVEDDPAVRLLLATVLEADGVVVDAHEDAESALAALQDGRRPDILLCDLLLPGVDGIALTEWVREHHIDANVPILLISSSAQRHTRLRALDVGADDLLNKPVDPLELRARVRSLAHLSRARARLVARERIDAVLAEVADGVALIDARGHLRDANPRARALLALPDGFHGPLLDHLRTTFDEVEDRARAHEDRTLHHRPRRGPEPPLWLSVRVLAIPDDPDGGGAVVIRDVTEEQSAQALADLVLSSVAHKLRTPMTGIISVASSLEAMVEEGPQSQLVGILQRSSQRLDTSLRRIIEHAAAIARTQDDQPVLLQPGTVSLALRDVVNPSSLAVVERLDDRLTADVAVPVGAIVAAIDEFVDNAREAGDDEPTLTVASEGGDLVVRVDDRGVGFQPEEAERLFTPFHQEDRTGQNPRMGLGLPLVRHLVARAGGRVRARSIPGQVTSFEARFPQGRPEPGEGRVGWVTDLTTSGLVPRANLQAVA